MATTTSRLSLNKAEDSDNANTTVKTQHNANWDVLDEAVLRTSTDTLTNKTLTSPVLNGTLSGTGVGTGATQVAAGNHSHSATASGLNWLGAGTWEFPAANFPQPDKYASLTNWPALRVLRFDASTDETCYLAIRLPANTPVATITAKIVWFSNSATTGSVRWQLTYLSRADDEALDTAGTTGSVGGAAPATAKQLQTDSISVTVTGIAAGELLLLALNRDANGTSGTDDFAEDAYLVGVSLEFA